MATQIEKIRQMEEGEPPQRVISTASTNKEQVDLPFTNEYSFTNPASILASSESLQSTTINEKLYQPLNTKQGGDPMYAQIRPTARRERKGRGSHEFLLQGSPTREAVDGVGNYHYQSEQANHRRNTLPVKSNIKSPVHYTEPHSHTSIPKNRRIVGTHAMTSSPTLHQPRPYCEPVSSMGSLRTVGIIHDTDSTKNTRTISSPTVAEQLPDPPCSVDEGGSSQQWYNSGDSDIVTPTSRMTYSNDTTIEPYASTPSSLIKASPYSQPSTDWQGMVDSNSPASSSQQEEHTDECTYNLVDV